MTSEPSAADSVWASMEHPRSVADTAALASVPVVLAAAYGLPTETKRGLALSYADPTVLSAFANHYVHLSPVHLLVNVLGYVLVASTVYLLALAADRREQFFVVFTVFLLALPFALSAFNLLVFTEGSGVGFSGIVMAFLGYLPLVLTRFLGERLGLSVTGVHSSWLFFFGLAVVSLAAAPGIYGPGVAAAALLSGVLFLLPVVEEARREGLREAQIGLFEAGSAEMVMLGVVVFVSFPLIAFPADVRAFGGRINVYGHAMGFCLGYLVTYVTLLVGGLDLE